MPEPKSNASAHPWFEYPGVAARKSLGGLDPDLVGEGAVGVGDCDVATKPLMERGGEVAERLGRVAPGAVQRRCREWAELGGRDVAVGVPAPRVTGRVGVHERRAVGAVDDGAVGGIHGGGVGSPRDDRSDDRHEQDDDGQGRNNDDGGEDEGDDDEAAGPLAARRAGGEGSPCGGRDCWCCHARSSPHGGRARMRGPSPGTWPWRARGGSAISGDIANRGHGRTLNAHPSDLSGSGCVDTQSIAVTWANAPLDPRAGSTGRPHRCVRRE